MFKSTYNSSLKRFKDIHKGESAILFATGPSIKDYKWFDGSDNCILFGLNRIYNYSEITNRLNYYYYGSHYVSDPEHRKNINDVCSRNGLISFASAYEEGRSHKDINRGNISPEEAIKIGSIPFENNLSKFTNDPSEYATLGHSIVFPPLQHILYMGITTIYLVGCDGGFMAGQSSGDDHLLSWWQSFVDFKKQYYENVSIISINPVSLKGWFDDTYI